jgi:hypothetical protein
MRGLSDPVRWGVLEKEMVQGGRACNKKRKKAVTSMGMKCR